MIRRFWLSFLLVFVLSIALYVGAVRPYIMRWGATDAELSMPLAGDPYIPADTIVSTRALTIHAPPETIWPWLVQIGQGRGGFYTLDWLENLFAAGMHNAESIEPALQNLTVGTKIYYQKDSFFEKVSIVDPPHAVGLGGWSFNLIPIDADSTRLVVRYPSFPVRSKLDAFYYYVIFEPAHFVMEAGMMLGLKTRAEGSGT